MHGQADDFRSEPFSNRQAAFGDWIWTEWFLSVDRMRVVYGGRNAVRTEPRCELFAPFRCNADRVLGPNRGGAFPGTGDGNNIGQQTRITLCDLVARGDLRRKDLELFDQHGGLNAVES